MSEQNYLTPAQIAAATADASVAKAALGPLRQLVLAILAGAYIAFASEGSNMAAFNLLASPQTYGLGKALAGVVFGTGLMLVIAAGGELFTGNALMLTGVFERRITAGSMLRNWLVVYAGKFVGSMLVVHMMIAAGLFNRREGLSGGWQIPLAAHKTQTAAAQIEITTVDVGVDAVRIAPDVRFDQSGRQAGQIPFSSPAQLTIEPSTVPGSVAVLQQRRTLAAALGYR